MKSWLLFLHGRYPAGDIPFYKKLCKNQRLVAVDGGYSFFKKSGLVPDVIIGDMDSIGHLPKKLPADTEILTFPTRKNQTDSQLALEYSIRNGARRIDIVMPTVGEPDHFLGVVMLLSAAGTRRWVKAGGEVGVVNRAFEIICLHDRRKIIKNAVGQMLSVVPISSTIHLNLTGTEYPAKNLTIKRGDSRPLRNVITSKTAAVEVRGEALVIRRLSGANSISTGKK